MKRLQIVRKESNATNSTYDDDETQKHSADMIIDQLGFDVQQSSPFTWSFTHTLASNIETSAAGLGGPAMSGKEEKLRAEIDLIFTYLCKVGQIWPLAKRQAQGLAQMLGIDVAAPEALEHGIFNERNWSVHH